MKNFSRWIVVAAMSVAACGGTAASSARMGSAQAAIRSAQEVGAEQDPTAALHLQYAREQYASAERLSRDGEGEQADRTLARSEADADLALAIARRSHATRSAAQASSGARTLQNAPAPTPAPITP